MLIKKLDSRVIMPGGRDDKNSVMIVELVLV
jgi:hypothetical protein